MKEATVATDELIEFIADCMAMGYRKGKLKQLIYKVNGDKCARATVEKILGKARQLLLDDARTNKDNERAEAIGFYKAIIADDDTTVREKIEARSKLDDLLGLGAKFTTDYGKTAEERAEEIRIAQEQMREVTDHEDQSQSSTIE
jgi:molecular chaperone DnaK (HSP70)